MRTLLDVQGLCKLYARTSSAARQRAAKTLGETLLHRKEITVGTLQTSEFWALHNINFQVARGEALGIIGLNGSGKTTLLRILAGQLLPDAGEIHIDGNTGALIDLTAGFRMTASGAQNIFLKGAMLGRSVTEIEAAYDEIISFAELDDAIDAPVSSYSSGMIMRLAMAINLASQPDILLIDETLAVGDFRFRQKCLARIRMLRERCSVVLVSHSMGDIRRFCSRAIVLHKGKIAFEGLPDAAIAFYEAMEADSHTPEQRKASILQPWFHNSDAVFDVENYWCNSEGQQIEEIYGGEALYFHVCLTLRHAPRHMVIGIPLWTESGQHITGFSTEFDNDHFAVEAGKKISFRLEIPNLGLNPGVYISNLGVMDGPEYLLRVENPPLAVKAKSSIHWGAVTLPHKWRQITHSEISRMTDSNE